MSCQLRKKLRQFINFFLYSEYIITTLLKKKYEDKIGQIIYDIISQAKNTQNK